MLRDVFYYGTKPNVHPREQFAENLEDARQKCTTEHFWIINEFCDYRNFDWDFDFEFLPDEDVWAEDHNNVWPSQHQKDSGTWLCPKEYSDITIYRGDVDPVIRKNEKQSDNWVELDLIDHNKFDFSWHPDPTDPPYIYKWGCKFFPTELKHVLEYRVPGATQEKYMITTVELLPQTDRWTEHQAVDHSHFDFSWRPNPLDPPLNYVWGNKYIDGTLRPTLEYRVPGATDIKYMPEHVAVLPEWDKWEIPNDINKSSFDFSWRPDPREPNFIYEFGTQWQKTGGPRYISEDATEVKYLDAQTATRVATVDDNWEILNDYQIESFDYSWHPDNTDGPYIYVFGNNLYSAEEMPTIEYRVPGATETKYIHNLVAKLGVDMRNWDIPSNIDVSEFDFSWKPNPGDPEYIYEFGTQWQKTGGPKYVVEGATETKYVDGLKAKALPNLDSWEIPDHVDVTDFDFSWHPDATDPAYIYQFGTQWALTGGPRYVMEGATEVKYIDTITATALTNKEHWVYDENEIDVDSFDFSWHPYVEDQPYIYQFGTQWQKTGGPRYITPGADNSSPVKYIDTRILRATRLPNLSKFEILNDYKIKDFDYSWHPDDTDDPFIYQFGNNLYSAEEMPTIQYVTEDAEKVKYVSDLVAKLDVDMTNWEVPDNIDTTGFDFSWKPNPHSPPYIYEFATQWQKTGGPKYVVEGATEKQYVDFQKVKKLPSRENWTVPDNIDTSGFDFSWHPDDTSPPYIYVFATQWALSGGPVYTVEGATTYKFLDEQVAVALTDMTHWLFDETEVDVDSFDFSWHPYAGDDPYIYQFGTQWQKTGGPKYVPVGATSQSPIKYIDTRILKAKRLPKPTDTHWHIVNDYPVIDFDWSWHPDDTDEPYIYVFGNKYYTAEQMPTIEYRVEGATQVKYINDIIATLGPSKDGWDIPENVDTTDFDFSWRPSPLEEPYIYVFGTQWQKTGGPRYAVEGATQVKYVEELKAIRLADMTNWEVPDNINITGFDFSWHPDDTATPFIYQFGTQWALTGGPRYVVPGATEISYVEDMMVTVQPCMDNWEVPDDIDASTFDFSWHPYAADDPFIYQFGTQWQKTGGPRYIVPGATNIKYIDTRILKATKLPNKSSYWEVPDDVDVSDFDWSWHPDDTEEPFIYQFGTQWQKTGGPRYVVPGATTVNYISNPKARSLPSSANWTVPNNIDKTTFDFSWHPDDTNPPYIYVFATQWALSGGPIYTVPGATEVKYVEDQNATALADMSHWVYDPSEIDVNSFDFSWHPYAGDDPYIYQFGTQWQKTGGPRYIAPGADNSSPVKYIDPRIIKAKRLPNRSKFTVLGGAKIGDFDYSWHPDDTSPPYIYQFGNNWYPAEEMPTIEYSVEGATEAKFVTDIVARLAPNMENWRIPENIDVSRFDFSWIPHPTAEPYIYQFGTSSDPTDGPSYIASGNKGQIINVPRVELQEPVKEEAVEEIEEIIEQPAETNIIRELDIFFVDKGNSESNMRFETLKAKFGNRIQKTRYLNSWVDTINRCINRATSDLIWILNSELDYTGFDFSYYPNMWQMKMVHVFGTQWSHWGTTFLINRETFPTDTKYIKIIEHLSNLNFVKTIRATATSCLYDVLYIDHGNDESATIEESIKHKIAGKNIINVKYDNSYLNTIKNHVTKLPEKKEHYIWICSSVCNYDNFDFSYICDPFSKENLHVFPSGSQKFGDTFLIDVNKTKLIINDIEKLEEYEKVNYNNSVKTQRLPEPVIVTTDDTHVNSINKINGFPYATIVTEDNLGIDATTVEPMNLWSEETKNIVVTSTGSTRIVVPKEAKDFVTRELYDYPYIKRLPKLIKSKPLDIVFLSNGETKAEENWEHLLKITEGLPNRVVRVDGVNGRAAAYHAAAEASNTPWMFTVFAKLKVSPKFDFNWQPDRMQVPKHYIFHAKNPVNGLVYGHQAMIAYNKKLTLANEGHGLDFTLDDEHEIVPLISGTANYNTDPFSTWRTAFREVLKLKADDSEESRVRLDAWLNKAEGDFAQFSIKGAIDADEYYDEVDGDFNQLKLSYEWEWLRNKFEDL